MSEAVMNLIRMGLEVLEARIMMWVVVVFTFILFLIAINRPEINVIITATIWAVLVYLPMLWKGIGGSGGV